MALLLAAATGAASANAMQQGQRQCQLARLHPSRMTHPAPRQAAVVGAHSRGEYFVSRVPLAFRRTCVPENAFSGARAVKLGLFGTSHSPRRSLRS